ncbi:FecR family protein [Parafilimonas sp.]|uniref:FecR family protein n=1 Tax=Parafilimonas sp. TaxID=1969739 RepID=UPI0039E570C0
MNEKLLQELINKYFSGTVLPEEEQLLQEWYESSIPDKIIIPFLSEIEKNELMKRMRTRVRAYARGHTRQAAKKNICFRIIPVAASIVILLGAGYLVYQYSSIFHQKNDNERAAVKEDILPGHSGAILTLADGSKHVLDSAGNGVLISQAGASITKQGNQIIYSKVAGKAATVAYNTLIVPKGRAFKIILPDGTSVWLNSASSLRYPTVFAGKERVVELEGEAYFEVIHNAQQPFKVKVNNTVIEDIGTSFNINAYADEPFIKTTLIKGSIKISNTNVSGVLKPGEQAVTSAYKLTVSTVDTGQVLAWKDGFFQFDDADLYTIMRQLARWYNIKVSFEGNIPSRKFYGRINRNMNLSEVLSLLMQNQVHFDIDTENRLIVKP